MSLPLLPSGKIDFYEWMQRERGSYGELVNFYFANVVKQIYRKLTFKEKFKNPWKIISKIVVPFPVFNCGYRAIRDFVPSIGKTTKITNDCKGRPKEYILTFTLNGPFKMHMDKLSGNSIDVLKFMKKKDKIGNIAKVNVTENSPATLVYKVH